MDRHLRVVGGDGLHQAHLVVTVGAIGTVEEIDVQVLSIFCCRGTNDDQREDKEKVNDGFDHRQPRPCSEKANRSRTASKGTEKPPAQLPEHATTMPREKTVSPNNNKKGVVKYSGLLTG